PNIPDGSSNTVGIVERFGNYPQYVWSNVAYYPCAPLPNEWGWNEWSSVYGGAFPVCGKSLSSRSHYAAAGCGVGGLIGTLAFSSSGISGDSHSQPRVRSCPISSLTRTNVSSQRSVTAAARSTNAPSAFSSCHINPGPLSRRLMTRRTALSIAPLPIGNPFLRNCPYAM